MKIFLVTLIITVLLSIYLSGVIANPLRRLARAAENVRKGKATHTDIPDMSDRHDEIGGAIPCPARHDACAVGSDDAIESFAADVAT